MKPSDLPSRPPPDDAAPLPLGKRLRLLLALVLVPFALVCVPGALIFHFSNRQWTFAAWGKPKPPPDVSSLRGALELSAQKGLPEPAPLDAAPIELRSTPERVAARVEKITRLAQDLGGSAAEGLAVEGAKHLYVDLPAGRAGAFRESIKGGSAALAPAPAASPGGAREHVEVVIHTGDE